VVSSHTSPVVVEPDALTGMTNLLVVLIDIPAPLVASVIPVRVNVASPQSIIADTEPVP